MKYSEFKKLMEDKGFYIKPNSHDVRVCGEDDFVITSISKSRTLALNTDYTTLIKLDEETRRFVAQSSMELAFTELGDREEEEEKYYLKLKGIDGRRFLNALSDYSEYFIEDKIQVPDGIITQFTQSEIEELPECYTHPAVWEKIKVESEEQ